MTDIWVCKPNSRRTMVGTHAWVLSCTRRILCTTLSLATCPLSLLSCPFFLARYSVVRANSSSCFTFNDDNDDKHLTCTSSPLHIPSLMLFLSPPANVGSPRSESPHPVFAAPPPVRYGVGHCLLSCARYSKREAHTFDKSSDRTFLHLGR